MKRIAALLLLTLFALTYSIFFEKSVKIHPQLVATPSFAEFKAMKQQEQFAIIKNMHEESGSDNAWKFIKDAYSGDSSLGGNSHDLAHYIGILIYEKHNLEGFGICDSTFAFGCYHGFTESIFSTSLDKIGELENACETVGNVRSGPWASCIHGIGHGVATFYDSTALDRALEGCKRLKKTGQTYCYDGVFMEFAISAPVSFYQISNPTYPCDGIDHEYKSACGRNLPQVMGSRFNMSEKSIIDICLNVNDDAVKFHCMDVVGLKIGQRSRGNSQFIISNCNKLPSEVAINNCVGSAVKEIIFQNYPGWQESYRQACNSLAEFAEDECFQKSQMTITSYREGKN